MGHQVNFYLCPTDLRSIECTLREVGPLTILHSRSSNPKPRNVESLELNENGQLWLYFYLVRPEDIRSVTMTHIPAQAYWTVDVLRSPVVEFNRCFFDEIVLRRGRLYYIDKFYGSDGTTLEKPMEFVTWAKSLLLTTKKALKRHGSDYIGPDAKEWLLSSEGSLES